MSDYESGSYEKLVMEVLTGLDSQIDYSDYDGNSDGIIDCLAITVPLDGANEETLKHWYGNTSS